MRCPNCGAEISKDTKICRACEFDLRDYKPQTPEQLQEVFKTLQAMPEELQSSLRVNFDPNKSMEDFANSILLGSCPACESSNVGDCENDPDYMDITLGRCFDCSTVWCSECDHVLEKDERCCPNQAEHLMEYED